MIACRVCGISVGTSLCARGDGWISGLEQDLSLTPYSYIVCYYCSTMQDNMGSAFLGPVWQHGFVYVK